MKVGATTAYETTPIKPFEDEDDAEIIKKINQCPKGVYILNIASSLCNTFILSTSGNVFSFGLKCESLGRKVINQADAQKPGQVQIQTKIVQICAGTNHAMALDSNGTLFTWGRNEFGQLGHNDDDNQNFPKEVDFFKKDPVLQIYAGGDSSYAVTRKGSLFVWGDNRNYQLGLIGQVHYEPKLIIHTPWENSKELRIVYGKNNSGFMFILENSAQDIQNDILNNQINELVTENQRLQAKLFDMQNVGQRQPLQLEKNMNEDSLLKQVQTQLQSAQGLQTAQKSTIKAIQEEQEQLDKELQSIKTQLFDISNKENELNNQREIIDMEVRRFERSGGNAKEKEAKIKDQKRIKELFQANDNIKNNLLRRQNQSEEGKLRKQEEQSKQLERLKDLQGLIALLQTVESDRKIALRRKFLEQNKADLEKFMDKINHFFKQMLESNISDIARKSTQLTGVGNLITQSNEKLLYIKNELLGFKVNSNDESYEILSKILDILQDNLSIRKRLNEYMAGVIMTVNEKQQKAIKLELKDKQEQKVLEFIQNQQTNIKKSGKEYADSKKYKLEIQQQNNVKLKQREFCFGMF